MLAEVELAAVGVGLVAAVAEVELVEAGAELVAAELAGAAVGVVELVEVVGVAEAVQQFQRHLVAGDMLVELVERAGPEILDEY